MRVNLDTYELDFLEGVVAVSVLFHAGSEWAWRLGFSCLVIKTKIEVKGTKLQGERNCAFLSH